MRTQAKPTKEMMDYAYKFWPKKSFPKRELIMKTKILTLITDRMTEKNIGKAELSKGVNIGRTSLWRYLKGEKEMTLETLVKICDKLDLKILIVIK